MTKSPKLIAGLQKTLFPGEREASCRNRVDWGFSGKRKLETGMTASPLTKGKAKGWV